MKTVGFLIFLLSTHFIHTENKQVVLILGIRSGTSALTGILEILGIYLGQNLYGAPNSIEAREANAKGFFEDKTFGELNEVILNCMKSSWDDTRKLKFDLNSPEMRHYIDAIKTTTTNSFKNVKTFGLKNPRITNLLPLYLKAFEELAITPKIIITQRDTEEVALSLVKNCNLTFEHAIKFKKRRWKEIAEYTQGYTTLEVHFKDLIQNTQKVINDLKAFLPELDVSQANCQRVAEFIDESLAHITS